MKGTGMNKRAVPEGHLTIAQRFNVGTFAGNEVSPEGTADTTEFSRPFGTQCSSHNGLPTLKRWAIIGCPSGTGCADRGAYLRIRKLAKFDWKLWATNCCLSHLPGKE